MCRTHGGESVQGGTRDDLLFRCGGFPASCGPPTNEEFRMKALGLLLLGLLIGAVASVSALNALRKATAFPRGVMAVQGHHMGKLREAVTADPCEPASAQRHLQALQILTADIEPAFLPDGQQDEIFSRYAAQMGQRIDSVLATLPQADCATLRISLGDIGDGCKACHRDYK
jgi:cytochrome c556